MLPRVLCRRHRFLSQYCGILLTHNLLSPKERKRKMSATKTCAICNSNEVFVRSSMAQGTLCQCCQFGLMCGPDLNQWHARHALPYEWDLDERSTVRLWALWIYRLHKLKEDILGMEWKPNEAKDVVWSYVDKHVSMLCFDLPKCSTPVTRGDPIQDESTEAKQFVMSLTSRLGKHKGRWCVEALQEDPEDSVVLPTRKRKGVIGPNERSTVFSMTLNNYTEDEFQALGKLCPTPFNFFFAGKETGADGTPHLQCCARTRNPTSIAALRKHIEASMELPCRFHIEVSRCEIQWNIEYCSKGQQSKEEWDAEKTNGPNYGFGADTVEYGTRPNKRGKRTDLDDVVKAIQEGKGELQIATEHGMVRITSVDSYLYFDK